MHLIVFGISTTLASMFAAHLAGFAAWWGIPAVLPFHLFLICGLYHPRSSLICPTISRAPGSRPKSVALTFDDGPHPDVTPQVLEILARNRVPATFFMIGRNVRRYPETARAVAEAGHEIGNHSYLHPLHIVGWRRNAVARDTRLAQRAIQRAVGAPPIWYRPPIGFRNVFLRSVLRSLNLQLVNFTFRTYDAVARRPETIVNRILAKARPGAVILLHDGTHHPHGARPSPLIEALPRLIERLRADGFEFQSLRALLSTDRPTLDRERAPEAAAHLNRLPQDHSPIILGSDL